VVLSKRERSIAIATVAMLAAVVFYVLVIDPELTERANQSVDIDKAQLALKDGAVAQTRSLSVAPRWKQLVAGPLKTNNSDAASQLLPSIDKWAKESGMTALSITQPERIEKEKDFSKFTFRATAKSNAKQLAAFMYRIQTATIPVRISDLTVTAPKEGTDELQVQIGITTIFLSPEPETKPGAALPRESKS